MFAFGTKAHAPKKFSKYILLHTMPLVVLHARLVNTRIGVNLYSCMNGELGWSV